MRSRVRYNPELVPHTHNRLHGLILPFQPSRRRMEIRPSGGGRRDRRCCSAKEDRQDINVAGAERTGRMGPKPTAYRPQVYKVVFLDLFGDAW